MNDYTPQAGGRDFNEIAALSDARGFTNDPISQCRNAAECAVARQAALATDSAPAPCACRPWQDARDFG